jgi:hypothetical protein
MLDKRSLALAVLVLEAFVFGAPAHAQPADAVFEFSLDIGSDHELSDPFMDGDEGFDPGDVYWWQGPPVDLPGRDGFKDDLSIFGFDPWPDPPDPAYATRVPVGEGNIEFYWEYFDLDGHDQLADDLYELQFIPPDRPLENPIPQWDSPCIYPAEFLMISFDDDMAPGWPAFDVPVTQTSPAGVSSYGSTPGRDEIVGLTLLVGAGPPPYPIVNIYPIADELTVHQSLMANPDNLEEEDDDVDSLDIVHGYEECPFWYFTVDHEAHLGLDPGGIYEVTFGGPVQIIDELIHLGIPEETDIDAFEFAWLELPNDPGPLYFALLYSVDEDDPLTQWDESGGLPANMIFASFLTGWSFPVVQDELWDDVDALTGWGEPFEPQPPTGACCLPGCGCVVLTQTDCLNNGGVWAGPGTDCSDADGDGIADACFTCIGDLDCDNVVDLGDLAQLLSNYGQTSGVGWTDGDMDADGDVDLADLAVLLGNYSGC